jgi:hypothetical protein
MGSIVLGGAVTVPRYFGYSQRIVVPALRSRLAVVPLGVVGIATTVVSAFEGLWSSVIIYGALLVVGGVALFTGGAAR